MFRGIMYDYCCSTAACCNAISERVERYLQARGFYEAKARAGRIVYTSDDHVEVTVEVEEGPRVVIEKISIEGNKDLDEKENNVEKAVAAAFAVDDPFEEEPYKNTEKTIERALTDRGYAWAGSSATPRSTCRNKARLQFVVTPGPKATFGKIKVEGPERRSTHRQTMYIDPGDEYSTAKMDEARDAILGLAPSPP
jgi:outer membrane protein assembly factor BamA